MTANAMLSQNQKIVLDLDGWLRVGADEGLSRVMSIMRVNTLGTCTGGEG
jgi:hypothetical protein